MRRLSLWVRAHPMVGDGCLAVLIGLLDAGLYWNNPDLARWYIVLPVIIATVLPLLFRRSHPIVVAYAVLFTGAAHGALELAFAAFVTAGIAIYTLVVYVSRKHTALYFTVVLLVTVGQILVQVEQEQWVSSIGFTLAVFVFSWVLGEFLGARRAYQAELEARLHLLENEREHLATIAVAEERERIARELHDVLAHSVSVIVVHADGAAYALDSNTATARTAIHTISETGRAALTELRRLLDVLRNPGAEPDTRQPQPTSGALTELVDRMRASGLDARLERADELDDLPASLSLGVYRVVQESLTNVLKHAGTGAKVGVTVDRRACEVLVTVADDGAGKAHPIDDPQPETPEGGNGIIGMRERVHVLSGTLDVGPQSGGGWRAHATFPAPQGNEAAGGAPARQPDYTRHLEGEM